MKQFTTFANMANSFFNVLQGYTKGIRFVAVLTLLLTMGIGQAWGETIYTNTGTTGTTNGITASGNINDNNGNTKPSFGLTSSSKNTITLTGLNLTSYTNVAMTFDYQLAKSGSSFSSLTVTQYNSNNVSISTTNITGSNNTSYKEATIALQSACTKITIVCKPAGSTYNTYVDNINITGDLASLPWFLKGSFDNWGNGKEMTEISTGKARVTLDLAANTQYEFKFLNGSNWLGNSGTINADISNWVFKTTESSNVKLNSGLGGTFTFTIDYSASTTQPKVTVTYPRKTIYLKPGVWNADGAKYAIYYFINGQDGWSGLMTQGTCDKDVYSATIPQWNGLKMDLVRLNSDATSGDWNKKWNQTNDITINSNDYVTITGWDQANFTYTTYTPPTYTITFSGNGNTGGSMNKVTGIPCEGSTTLVANGYTRTGYTFNNWKTNVAVTANSSSVEANGTVADKATISNITSDITLTARWKANTYTITLNGNNGSGHTASVTATYNSATLSPSTITNPTRAGYTFGGWYSASGGTGSMVIGTDGKLQANVSGYTGANGIWTATASKTLYAKWTANTYKITLSAPNSSISLQDVQATYNSSSITGTITNPTKTGYTFKGWYSGENGIGSLVISANKQLQANVSSYTGANGVWSATENKTLYAGWTINSYTLTWNVNGGNELTGTYTSGTVEYGVTITKPADPTRTGYSFLGWHDGTDIVTPATTMPDHDLTYTAQWQILSYTVTWVVDGDETGETVNHGAKVADAPDINPNNLPCGQKFAGWTDKPITGTTDNVPDPLYKTAAEIPAIETAKTFYAVFADYENE